MSKFVFTYTRSVACFSDLCAFFLIFDVIRLSLKHIGEGGSLAEEVISTVRTTHAFGTQKTLGALYNRHVNDSLKVELLAAIWQGGCTAAFFFAIYGAYALGTF